MKKKKQVGWDGCNWRSIKKRRWFINYCRKAALAVRVNKNYDLLSVLLVIRYRRGWKSSCFHLLWECRIFVMLALDRHESAAGLSCWEQDKVLPWIHPPEQLALGLTHNRTSKCVLNEYTFLNKHPRRSCFPSGSLVKNPSASEGDAGLIPGSGRSPGVGNDNSLQYSCLGNPMDKGAWWARAHRVPESRTWLSD